MVEPKKADLVIFNGKIITVDKDFFVAESVAVRSDRIVAVGSFINGLKREGLTSLLTRESPTLLGEASHEDSNVAFVVDSYTLLRYVEIESTIHRALLVLKMRGSDHAKDIRRFEIDHGGIRVIGRFEGQEGLLTGSPRRMPNMR